MLSIEASESDQGLTSLSESITGKMLGGCSSINAMIYQHPTVDDLAEWVEKGATGWSYTDLKPYMRKAERFTPSPDHKIDESVSTAAVEVATPASVGADSYRSIDFLLSTEAKMACGASAIRRPTKSPKPSSKLESPPGSLTIPT